MNRKPITLEEALEKLNRIKSLAGKLTDAESVEFGIFNHKSKEILESIFGSDSWRVKQFNDINWHYNPGVYFAGMDLEGPSRRQFQAGVQSVNTLVDDAIADINSGEITFKESSKDSQSTENMDTETGLRSRTVGKKIFVTHGSSGDWQQVQRFIEKRLNRETVELAEMLSRGRTVIEKLEAASDDCFYAVIVMTGDDIGNRGAEVSTEEAVLRVRENVMHEIGFFQGRYGRKNVILLHENDVSIPSNLQGIVYEGFPKGYINATFEKLREEIEAAISEMDTK